LKSHGASSVSDEGIMRGRGRGASFCRKGKGRLRFPP
jgi:hypothetical protein